MTSIPRIIFQTAIEHGIRSEWMEEQYAEALRALGREATEFATMYCTGCPAAKVGLYEPNIVGTRGVAFAHAFDDVWISYLLSQNAYSSTSDTIQVTD